MTIADELRRLADMHARGHLTDEEFSSAKARILGGASAAPETHPPETAATPRTMPSFLHSPRWIAAGVVLVLATIGLAVGVTTLGADDDDTPPSSSITTAPTASMEPDPDEEVVVADEVTEEPPSPDDVTIEQSGWTPMYGRAIGSWGLTVHNNTDVFADVALSIEQVDSKGAIVNSSTEEVTLEPRTVTPIGGSVPLDMRARELEFAVIPDTYNRPDDDYYVPNVSEVKGKLIGRDINGELDLSVTSGFDVDELCPIYVMFSSRDGEPVGGAMLDEHPPVPGGTTKTFKLYMGDDVHIPWATATISGYADVLSC